MGWLALLKEYQTGIGALIGFTGVIVTLVVNALLARRQSERAAKLARQQATDQIAQERGVLRTALRAEAEIVVGYLRFDLDHMKEAKTKSDGSSYNLRIDYPTKVHDRHTDKLGLLTLEQAKKVTMAYAYLHSAPAEIRWLKRSTQEQHGPLAGEDQYIISIPASILDEAIEAWHTTCSMIQDAVEELQKPEK